MILRASELTLYPVSQRGPDHRFPKNTEDSEVSSLPYTPAVGAMQTSLLHLPLIILFKASKCCQTQPSERLRHRQPSGSTNISAMMLLLISKSSRPFRRVSVAFLPTMARLAMHGAEHAIEMEKRVLGNTPFVGHVPCSLTVRRVDERCSSRRCTPVKGDQSCHMHSAEPHAQPWKFSAERRGSIHE